MYERIGKTRSFIVYPARAEDLLRQNTFSDQRKLDPFRVQCYMEMINDGSFREAEIAMAIVPGGGKMLMNGQHTLQACVMSGKPIMVNYTEYQCHDNDDLWRLFGSFDGNKIRSDYQIMKAAQGLFGPQELRDASVRTLQCCGSALLALGAGTVPNFHIRVVRKIEKAVLVQKYPAEIAFVAPYTQAAAGRMRVPTATAMISTYRVNPVKAKEFWDRIIIGDGLVRGTPQWNLHRFLTTSDGASEHQNGEAAHIFIYKVCIAWWNAFIDGVARRMVKPKQMKSIPDVRGKTDH